METKFIVQSVRDAWKHFKTKIKHKYFLPYENVEHMLKNRPKRVPPSEFIRLILYWSHPLIQEAYECRQSSGEIEKEAFQSLFEKEQQGRHQEEVSALQSQLGAVQTQQQQQAEQIHGLRKMVKLLLLHSGPDIRPEEVEALLQDAQHFPIDENSALI
ncbi:hypothetical protein PIB30_051441 [Stylosanthes scabra]|uniref:Uncharacterized protein n=1 Tax=Stylosanthes scabra TaxID=79078 RepID=A0ABU6RIF0_9FABA|nr:hypothetical protein [Stylosanthes scabra]